MSNTLSSLTEEAIAKATEIVTIERADGSTFQSHRGYGSAHNGVVQVYVVPVTGRTRFIKHHYRATFYLNQDDQWKRISRAAAEAALH